ncbi:MAG: DUF72 domain-containing protein [candidate division Zixibacteria bacterium]|nr:DUF72 domain-containing protein [candidate division Zixibacteria bacterium]
MAEKDDKINLIRFGTSSFSSRDWIGPFYAKGIKPMDFLKHYSRKFNAVEIDSTYYSIPSSYTVDGWLEKTPADFKISAKFPRTIVHAGKDKKPNAQLILNRDSTYGERDRFLEVMGRLKDSLGPLLIQFPYFSKNIFSIKDIFFERLDRFLGDLPKDFSYAVEIRNRHWLKKSFADMCRKHNVALVLADQAWMPHGEQVEKWFDPVTTGFSYIRLLGNRKEIEAITKSWEKEVIDQSGKLKRWAGVLKRLADREVEAYVFANNHYAGHAPATAKRLREIYIDLVNEENKTPA